MLNRIYHIVRKLDRRVNILFLRTRLNVRSVAEPIYSTYRQVDEMMAKPHYRKIELLCISGTTIGSVYHALTSVCPPGYMLLYAIAALFWSFKLGIRRPFANLQIFCVILLILYLTRRGKKEPVTIDNSAGRRSGVIKI